VGGNHEVEAVVELLTALAIQSCSAASADIIEIDLSGTAHGNCTGSDFRAGLPTPSLQFSGLTPAKGHYRLGMLTGGLLLAEITIDGLGTFGDDPFFYPGPDAVTTTYTY
jgi:hypothetical protein